MYAAYKCSYLQWVSAFNVINGKLRKLEKLYLKPWADSCVLVCTIYIYMYIHLFKMWVFTKKCVQIKVCMHSNMCLYRNLYFFIKISFLNFQFLHFIAYVLLAKMLKIIAFYQNLAVVFFWTDILFNFRLKILKFRL